MYELFIAYPPCCVVDTIVFFFCLVLFLDNEEMLASVTFGSPHLSETAAQGIISMMDPKFAQHISCNELGSVGSLEYIKHVLVRNFPVVRWLETLLEA